MGLRCEVAVRLRHRRNWGRRRDDGQLRRRVDTRRGRCVRHERLLLAATTYTTRRNVQLVDLQDRLRSTDEALQLRELRRILAVELRELSLDSDELVRCALVLVANGEHALRD